MLVQVQVQVKDRPGSGDDEGDVSKACTRSNNGGCKMTALSRFSSSFSI